jgi:two-component system sensor histidine kinase KdpD
MQPSTPNKPGTLPLRTVAIILGLLALATAGAYLLDHQVSLTSQAMLYVLVVVIAAYTLPLLASVLCALGAVTAFNFFFVPPRWTFAVDSQEHLIALFTMLLVALAISHLAAGLRRETELARCNEMRARQLQELATLLAGAKDSDAMREVVQQALDAAFSGPNHLALLQADGTLGCAANLDAGIRDGLRSCMRENAVLGPGTGRWPGLNAWYLPLGSTEQMQGAACIQNISAGDTQGREHAQALCALLAQTLWRLRLSADITASQAEAHRQQVQSTFLAAISHDLRTPLAAVVGAASALQTQRDKLSAADQQRLLDSIVREASYLSTVTENTLQLVQLTNTLQPLQRDWETMEEIVGSVLARVRARDPGRRIQSRVPEGLPLIRANAVLLAQLVGNLLDNALKYSSGAIDLVVSAEGGTMQVAVKDRGEAIALERQQAIFEPYARNDQSGQRGAGLGLALCRAIAQAHGGSLTVRRRNGGGNSFTFSMPVDPQQPVGDAACP